VVQERGSAAECARAVAAELAGAESEVATVVVGTGVQASDRDAVMAALGEAMPALRIEPIDGGPADAFLIGVE